jgi:hypothetical protein
LVEGGIVENVSAYRLIYDFLVSISVEGYWELKGWNLSQQLAVLFSLMKTMKWERILLCG